LVLFEQLVDTLHVTAPSIGMGDNISGVDDVTLIADTGNISLDFNLTANNSVVLSAAGSLTQGASRKIDVPTLTITTFAGS
jgi:hypothetical protein